MRSLALLAALPVGACAARPACETRNRFEGNDRSAAATKLATR